MTVTSVDSMPVVRLEPRVPPARRGAVTIVIQAALVLGLGGWLLLAPPTEGMMMLVPLTPSAARALPALALRDGTRLVAVGTTPGALLVYGRRADLAGRLLAHGILTMASPPGGCTPKVTA